MSQKKIANFSIQYPFLPPLPTERNQILGRETIHSITGPLPTQKKKTTVNLMPAFKAFHGG